MAQACFDATAKTDLDHHPVMTDCRSDLCYQGDMLTTIAHCGSMGCGSEMMTMPNLTHVQVVYTHIHVFRTGKLHAIASRYAGESPVRRWPGQNRPNPPRLSMPDSHLPRLRGLLKLLQPPIRLTSYAAVRVMIQRLLENNPT
eukprot:9273044-Pyramimonas_sp.AAC.1